MADGVDVVSLTHSSLRERRGHAYTTRGRRCFGQRKCDGKRRLIDTLTPREDKEAIVCAALVKSVAMEADFGHNNGPLVIYEMGHAPVGWRVDNHPANCKNLLANEDHLCGKGIFLVMPT